MKRKSTRDPIAAFERESRAARRVGLGSKCACGEDRPLALIPGSNPVICAACQRERDRKSSSDNHHPAGISNDPVTVPIPINDHRAILSPQQYEWPKDTWENQLGSPVLAGAARVRGFCETANYLIAALLIPNAEMLESLDAYLKERFGPKWWIGTPLEHFAPKRKREQ